MKSFCLILVLIVITGNLYSQSDSIFIANKSNDTINSNVLNMLPYWNYQNMRLLGSDSYTIYTFIDGIQLYSINHLPFKTIDNFYYTNNHKSVFIGNTIGDAFLWYPQNL